LKFRRPTTERVGPKEIIVIFKCRRRGRRGVRVKISTRMINGKGGKKTAVKVAGPGRHSGKKREASNTRILACRKNVIAG